MKKREPILRMCCLGLIILLCTGTVKAADDGFVISQQSFAKFSAVYQSWTDENNDGLSEISTPLFFYLPMNANLSMSLYSGQASVNNSSATDINGFTDTQLNMTYYMESLELLFHVGFNLPTGKKKLSLAEFGTSYILSLNHYDFQTPNFGQGLNIAPGVTWAKPLSDNIVLGLGLSFQLKGAYEPFENMTGKYDPGEEVLLTGGIDFKVGELSSASADVIFTTYGKDKLADAETFHSGNKWVVSGQFRTYFNYNELWIYGRYRSKDKNQIGIAGGFIEETLKTIPNQFELQTRYRMRLSPGLYGSLLGEARFFDESALINKATLYALGIFMEFNLSSNIGLPATIKYRFGDIENSVSLSGLDVGLSLVIKL